MNTALSNRQRCVVHSVIGLIPVLQADTHNRSGSTMCFLAPLSSSSIANFSHTVALKNISAQLRMSDVFAAIPHVQQKGNM